MRADGAALIVERGSWFEVGEGVVWPSDRAAERPRNKHATGLTFKKLCMLLRRTTQVSRETRNTRLEMALAILLPPYPE